MSTTSVGYNLFLGGSMAKGRELRSAQRGIAFSTGSAVSVSILILIVGSGFHQDGATKAFSISQLGDFIFQFLGTFGVVIFSLGFIGTRWGKCKYYVNWIWKNHSRFHGYHIITFHVPGAAFSSILTCPLAASLTADSVLNFNKKQSEDEENQEDQEQSGDKREMPRKYFLGLIFIMVVVSSVVISFNGKKFCLL